MAVPRERATTLHLLKKHIPPKSLWYRVTRTNRLHLTPCSGGRQGVDSHHLHCSWSGRRGGVLLAGGGVGGALGLGDGVAAAGLAAGGGVPLGVGGSGRQLRLAEGVADEHPLVGQVGHLAVHHALLSRVLL